MYYPNADSQLKQQASVALIMLTLFLAVAAEFIPWPNALLSVRPIFPMLALVYWAVHQPKVVNYAAAVVIGVIMDIANQALIGSYALSCVVVVLFANVLSNRFLLLTGVAQVLHVLIVLAIGQLCLYLLELLEEGSAPADFGWRLFMPSFSAAALWLLLPVFIRYLRVALFKRQDSGVDY